MLQWITLNLLHKHKYTHRINSWEYNREGRVLLAFSIETDISKLPSTGWCQFTFPAMHDLGRTSEKYREPVRSRVCSGTYWPQEVGSGLAAGHSGLEDDVLRLMVSSGTDPTSLPFSSHYVLCPGTPNCSEIPRKAAGETLQGTSSLRDKTLENIQPR